MPARNLLQGKHLDCPEELIVAVSEKVEKNFQVYFSDLESYLVTSINCTEDSAPKEPLLETNMEILQEKVKEHVKNTVSQTIQQLKIMFGENHLHHVFPECFFASIMENIKQTLEENLSKLKKQILESAPKDERLCQLDRKSHKIQKKGKKGKNKIPVKALIMLRNWLTEHFQDPYPSHSEKIRLAHEAGVSFKQVQNWFTNARSRLCKPSSMEEDFVSQIQYKLKETDKLKEKELGSQSRGATKAPTNQDNKNITTSH